MTCQTRSACSRIIIFLLAMTASASAQPLPAEPIHDPLRPLQVALEALTDQLSPAVVAIQARRRDEPNPAAVRLELGSGFILRADGMILTSEHVIRGAFSLNVTLHDGRRLRAALVAADPRSDLAVLQVDAEELPTVELGNADSLRRGRLVMAFGHPAGLTPDGPCAMAFGLVCAIARPLPASFGFDEDRYFGEMIQVTAPLGAGYSGGPLVDEQGRVVGVLTAGSARRESELSLAFAVPLNDRIRRRLDALLRGEGMDYGYLGVDVADAGDLSPERGTTPRDLTQEPPVEARDAAVAFDRRGAMLIAVYPDGPAHRAALRPGDVVVALDRVAVRSADHLVQRIGEAGPGHAVRIDYLRDGVRRSCEVVLSRRVPPVVARATPARSRVAFRGALLEQIDITDPYDAPPGALLIVQIDAGSPADRAGLTPGDLITRIDGRPLPIDHGDLWSRRTDDILLGLSNGGSALVRPADSTRSRLALDPAPSP